MRKLIEPEDIHPSWLEGDAKPIADKAVRAANEGTTLDVISALRELIERKAKERKHG